MSSSQARHRKGLWDRCGGPVRWGRPRGAVDSTLELLSQPTGVADPDVDAGNFGGSALQKLNDDDTDSGRFEVFERAGGVTTLLTRPLGVADPDTGAAFFVGASDGGNRIFLKTGQRMTADDNDTNRQ
jgi:hypothetical protein